MLAGAQQSQSPALAARQHAARQRGEQARAQRRGLAATGRADDPEQRRADEPRDELGDEPFAPAEDLRVVDVERREALERARDDLTRVGAMVEGAELDNVVGHVGLGRAETHAFRFRPHAGSAQAPRGRIMRPCARMLTHPLGVAATCRDEPRGRDLLAVAHVLARDRAHRVRVEGSQLQGGIGAGKCSRSRRNDEQGQGADGVGEPVERVDIVEHQQRWPIVRAHAVRPRGGALAGVVADRARSGMHLDGELRREPRLADAVLAGDQDQPSCAGPRSSPLVAQSLQLLLASGQGRPRVELRRQLRAPRQQERRILREDGLLESAKPLTRLDREVADEPDPRVLVDLQRLGLAVTPI